MVASPSNTAFQPSAAEAEGQVYTEEPPKEVYEGKRILNIKNLQSNISCFSCRRI